MKTLLLVLTIVIITIPLRGDIFGPSSPAYPQPSYEGGNLLPPSETSDEDRPHAEIDINACSRYITPDDPVVRQQLAEILDSWRPLLFSDYEAIRTWVAQHIRYVSDQEVHGVSDYWQFPKDTLERRTGDCEDFAILLCTFLRAYGYSAEHVYVVCGRYGDSYHAYICEWHSGKGWLMTEPQHDIWIEYLGFGSDWWLSQYEALFSFNDRFYYQGLPPAPAPVPPLESWEIIIHLVKPIEETTVVIQPGPLRYAEITLDLTDPENIEVIAGPSLPDDVKVIVQSPPTITSISPSQGTQGQTLNVIITGTNLTGALAMMLNFGSGITVNSFMVDSATQITASITISPWATTGSRDVSVITSAGTGTGSFTVMPALPVINSVSPNYGTQGQALSVTITGTNLSGATAVSFGSGITVDSFFGVADAANTELHQAQTAIAACMADAGVSVLTTYDQTTGWSGSSGVITAVVGGRTYDAAVYLNGGFKARYLVNSYGEIVGAINDSWSGIEWDSVLKCWKQTLESLIQITANISIAAGAIPGARDVSVTTPGGTAMLVEGFDVVEETIQGTPVSGWVWVVLALGILLIALVIYLIIYKRAASKQA